MIARLQQTRLHRNGTPHVYYSRLLIAAASSLALQLITVHNAGDSIFDRLGHFSQSAIRIEHEQHEH